VQTQHHIFIAVSWRSQAWATGALLGHLKIQG